MRSAIAGKPNINCVQGATLNHLFQSCRDRFVLNGVTDEHLHCRLLPQPKVAQRRGHCQPIARKDLGPGGPCGHEHIAAGDDGIMGRHAAARIAKRLLDLGLSVYEPDPLAAIEAAEAEGTQRAWSPTPRRTTV